MEKQKGCRKFPFLDSHINTKFNVVSCKSFEEDQGQEMIISFLLSLSSSFILSVTDLPFRVFCPCHLHPLKVDSDLKDTKTEPF